MTVAFRAEGKPAAQGSMRHIGNGRMISMSKGLDRWRKTVVEAAQTVQGEGWDPIDGAVGVIVTFYLPRPKTTKFRAWPAGTPDLDKLQRALGDALKMAGTFTDDARITDWAAKKRWAVGCEPGADVLVYGKDWS